MNEDLKKIIWICLALFPVLEVYALIPGFSLGIFLIILLFPFSYLLYKKVFNDRDFLYLSIAIILLDIISYIFCAQSYRESSLFWNNLIWFIIFIVILAHYTSIKVDPIYFKITIFISIIATIIVYYQSYYFYLKGDIPKFFLPLALKDRTYDELSINRPFSFFLEPGDYALFILPVFYYALTQKKTGLSVFLFSGLLLSQSSTALVMGAIIILYSFMNKTMLKQFYILFASIFVVFIVFKDPITEMLSSSFKLTQEKFTNAEDNSRLLGNLPVLFSMDLKQLILGLSIGQYQSFAYYKNIISYPFANMIFYTIFNCGLAGLAFIFFYLFRLMSKIKYKGFIIIYLFLSFSSSLFFNTWMFYLLLFSYAVNSYESQAIDQEESEVNL